MIIEHYLSKTRRDERYKEMKAQGLAVRRRTSHGSRLHPEYIRDAVLEGISYLTGFGNTDYLRTWENLYSIEG